MANTYRRRDLDNDDDILRDGEVLHVPLYLKDGQPNPDLSPLQRDVGEHAVCNGARRAQVTDGAGNAGLALRRPGYRIADGFQRNMSVYAAFDAEIATAYKNVGATEREFAGGRVDDVGGGRSGTEGSACAADNNAGDAMPVTDAREQAYLDYQNRIQNAWKDGR
jgi:hypothetical protein